MTTTPVPELEIKKMKQGMSYTSKEKIIILNVFKYFRSQFPDKNVTDLVRRTAKATGCSEKSVFQFRKEEASVEGFKEPSRTKIRKNININSRHIKYDNTVRTNIRNIIYDLQYKNIVPSLNTILKNVNEDNSLPNFSLMTLRRLMCDMGFSYQKNGNKAVLVEKPDNRLINFQNDVQVNPPQENKPLQLFGNPFPVNNQQPPYPPPMHKPHVPPAAPAPVADVRATMPPIHKPMHMAPPGGMGPPQHEPMMMGPVPNMMQPMQSHPHNISMMMNPRRDMMPHHMMPAMDPNRKREPMVPWMQGVVKHGQ